MGESRFFSGLLSAAFCGSTAVRVPASGNSQIVKVSADKGEILGRYEAGPASRGAGNPSRTTVAADGSVWFGNRGHDPGTVVHIGLVEAGQCEDRNGNG